MTVTEPCGCAAVTNSQLEAAEATGRTVKPDSPLIITATLKLLLSFPLCLPHSVFQLHFGLFGSTHCALLEQMLEESNCQGIT